MNSTFQIVDSIKKSKSPAKKKKKRRSKHLRSKMQNDSIDGLEGGGPQTGMSMDMESILEYKNYQVGGD